MRAVPEYCLRALKFFASEQKFFRVHAYSARVSRLLNPKLLIAKAPAVYPFAVSRPKLSIFARSLGLWFQWLGNLQSFCGTIR